MEVEEFFSGDKDAFYEKMAYIKAYLLIYQIKKITSDKLKQDEMIGILEEILSDDM